MIAIPVKIGIQNSAYRLVPLRHFNIPDFTLYLKLYLSIIDDISI